MTAIAGWLRFIVSLAAMAGFLWVISAAADHVWPATKWYLVALFLGIWLFMFARQFVGGIHQFSGATDAFVRHHIAASELPPMFQSLTHEKTLQQVIDEFGPPSRKFDLVAPVASDVPRAKFVAYEYELPYEAAVFVMPEPPGTLESRLRAVYYRPRADDDELFAPVRS